MCTWTFSSLSQTGEGSRYTIQESSTWQCIHFIRIHLPIPSYPEIDRGRKEQSQTHFFQTCFCRRASDRKLRQDVWSILGPQTLPKTCFKQLILGMWTWTISSLSQTGEWSRCTIPESPIWQCINFIRIHLSIPNSPGIYLVRKTLYKAQTHFSKHVFANGPLTENVGKMFGVYLVHRSCPRALSQKAYLLNVYRRHSQATEFIYFNVIIDINRCCD